MVRHPHTRKKSRSRICRSSAKMPLHNRLLARRQLFRCALPFLQLMSICPCKIRKRPTSLHSISCSSKVPHDTRLPQSSHLPVVHNRMYQAFNAIPEAKRGDTVVLTGSDGVEYLYVVTAIVKADINDGTTINLSQDGSSRLTLVTCDTLTAKSARYVLTSDFLA